MKAYQIRSTDEPPVLVDLPQPSPGPGEVLIEIRACGLNFADLLMARGQYQEKPPLPFTLGMEAAGTVVAQGPGVTSPAIGARVAVTGGQGGLAEFGVFKAAECVEIPHDMPFEDAAAFQIAYGTSYLGLGHRARLQPGETLLVLGAAGGVGLTAIEIGKLMGARVIASARGQAKLEICRQAGADHLIDSDEADLRETVRALGGADVVYDPVGGAQAVAALRALRPEGRHLVVGFASGEVPDFPANVLLVKNIDVIGYYWGGYARFAPARMAEATAQLFAWYEAGRIRPHIGVTRPLAEAAEAYELLRSRRSTGKVVVTIGTHIAL